MSSQLDTDAPHAVMNFPLYRSLPRLIKDPLKELERMGRTAGGKIFRLDLGASRPWVVTHPDHVQQVLRREAHNYLREGVFWRPLRTLMGDSILAERGEWEFSKRILQPVFTTRNVHAITDHIAAAVDAAVEPLHAAAASGRPIRVLPEMSRIVNETVIKVLFGDKISAAEAERLVPAMDRVAVSIACRFLLPFVPRAIPLPGDRAFKRAVGVMDDTLFGLVRRYREQPGAGHDIFTALCRARTPDGRALPDRWIRDNLLAMFATSTETTTVALTWLWPLLAARPEVAARLHAEIGRVVGDDRVVRPEHLRHLEYVKRVVQELLRLFPVGWMFPRIAVGPGAIGGVPLKAGQTVLISPFLTHRLPSVWPRPLEFDPDRFAPERAAGRHRYAYFPFGGGPHQCIGRHVFNVEAHLILANILSRFRPDLSALDPVEPRIGATLRPDREIEMTLIPVGPVQ
ncbi:MAG TPA: cytochrome P450 [Streptosporangiaceae bacterium]|nr:cytochrome P450 [Streptosporangiaceae bacterium]